MQRRTPLIRHVGPAIASGVQPDVHGLLGVLWEAASNVTFYANKVRRRVPPSLVHEVVAAPVRGLSQQQGTTGTRWIWSAHGNAVYRWYGPAPESIYPIPDYQVDETATKQATMPDFTHFGDWTIINSGQGQAVLYKHGIGGAPYAGPPPDVVAFQKKLNFMLAFGFGGRGTGVAWSDSDNIEDWTPTAENAAGDLFIEDFDTPIRAIGRLGNATTVYSEDQLALVQYISSPFYFGQRVALDGIGAVGKKAVTGDGQRNFGVSRNGIWVTDGISFSYIDSGILRDYLQDNVNWAQASKIVATRNDYRGTFEFYFPMLGSGSNEVTEGWSYDPKSGGWSKVLAFTAKDERRLFSRPIAGHVAGRVYLDENNPALDFPLTLRTKPLTAQVSDNTNLSDGHVVTRIDEIQVIARVASNVEFRLGSSMNSNDVDEWSDWYPVPTDSKTVLLDKHLPDGVYHTLDFRSTANNWDLDLQGFILWGLGDGTKRLMQ